MAGRKVTPLQLVTRTRTLSIVTRSMTKTAAGLLSTAPAASASGQRPANLPDDSDVGPRDTFRARVANREPGIALSIADLPWMREVNSRYLDKTGAIADFLTHRDGMCGRSRAFFVRPHLFGKSLMLSAAAEMLRAGALPPGVTPWQSYRPVDIDKVFGGLAVHERFLRNDPTLGTLLRQAHFVIHLGLSGAMTGDLMHASIKEELAAIAGQAFGPEEAACVRSRNTTGGALGALVTAVPKTVPVVLIVDAYGMPITSDVKRHRWEAAKAGLEALGSLLVATKNIDFGSRIELCIVTGAAKLWGPVFNRWANNFHDFTAEPLLCAAVDFTEQEIRTTYPTELQRLAASLGTDVDGAMQELDRHYSGYCFDGVTTCFNPFPVLRALAAGRLKEMELDAANGSSWLGLHPRDVLHDLMGRLHDPVDVYAMQTADFDIVDMAPWAQCVNVIPMLLQAGILTISPAPDLLENRKRRCVLPNLYARRSLACLMKKAMPDVLADVVASIAAAFPTRAPIQFDAEARKMLDQAIADHARRA